MVLASDIETLPISDFYQQVQNLLDRLLDVDTTKTPAYRLAKAERTLTLAGFTDAGGKLWKPPVAASAKSHLLLHKSLRMEIDTVRAMLDKERTSHLNTVNELEAAHTEIEFWRTKERVSAAADTYYMLCLEHDIPQGGSLVDYVDSMRDELKKLKG